MSDVYDEVQKHQLVIISEWVDGRIQYPMKLVC